MNIDIVNGIKKSDDEKELEDSPPLEDDEKKFYSVISMLLSKGGKRDGKGLKILTPKNY